MTRSVPFSPAFRYPHGQYPSIHSRFGPRRLKVWKSHPKPTLQPQSVVRNASCQVSSFGIENPTDTDDGHF